MKKRLLCFTLLCFASFFGLASAQSVAFVSARPTEVGLSASGLDEVTRLLQHHVDQGKITGAVAAVARHGRLGYLKAVGQRNSDDAMSANTLFRIASMTKAITSAAVMSLVEDGKLSLDDPLSRHLPEFASPRVLHNIEGQELSTSPAKREATIHDLLTHRSGLTYGWFGPEKLDSIYRHQNIPDLFVPIEETLADRIQRVANVPLKSQPGTSWDYSVSTDVLGRVIEVASGLTVEQFFHERFFRPLRMLDTHFAVPQKKQSRLAGLYTINEDKKLVAVSDTPVTVGFLKFSANYNHSENRFFSGGGGLVSSPTDYLRFLQMLLNGGELEGCRVLSRESAALMTSNQIGDMQIPFPGHGDGFGFGFGVVTDKGANADNASVGSFSWGGIFNTYFWVDPQEQLIGVLMTQLFPYDHLDLREQFKRLTYESIDDSGFERVYWYQQGKEHANPHFNRRQLRVNAPEASIHPEFASRSEPQSSGVARILIEEDLRKVRRVDLATEIWGGHPGTRNKRVTINGRSTCSIPEVGTVRHHCTHQYPIFNLQPKDLVNGYNALQFACDQGDTFWGHYIVDNASLRIGLNVDDPGLIDHKLADFRASVVVSEQSDDRFALRLNVPERFEPTIAAVHFQGRYFGYDENGNGWRTDWHGMTKFKRPYGVIGTAKKSPFEVEWDASLVPNQDRVDVRAVVEFNGAPELRYRTKPLTGLKIARPSGDDVRLFASNDIPAPFWSRAGRKRSCSIDLDVDPKNIVKAELHVAAWTGGAGGIQNYFTLNGTHYPVAEGSRHETVYSRIPVDPSLLRRGINKIELFSGTTHHGIEILSPGPTLAVRCRQVVKASASLTDANDRNRAADVAHQVRFTESAKDESAGGIDCYKIATASATYYLDKVGAGLSSLIDQDGNDWLGFHPKQGTGAAGEYRGFPNAVFKEAGSYFHARNSGTDPCVTIVEHVAPDRVVISATSHNGLWSGKYTFTAEACTFTMTKKPDGHNYWILYEGVPGGQYDDSDWWMTSSIPKKNRLTANHEGDITVAPGQNAEWIAFGDEHSPRMLVISHHEDDQHPDRFYQMQKKMTVFGFGREGMEKSLDTTPQNFSIGLVESTTHADAAHHAERWLKSTLAARTDSVPSDVLPSDPLVKRRTLERFALKVAGDAEAGKELFFKDVRTRCAACHRVDKIGGDVGPDLTKIGGKFDRPHLIESILEPSKQIVEGYRTNVVVTEDGAIHAGIAKSVNDHQIKLVGQDAVVRTITKTDIEEQHEANVSLMPTGVADLLSPQEFTDLVAYLETLRTGKAKFGSGVTGPIQLPDGFEVSTVATGLSGATALEVANDGRVFICEQHGSLRVIKDGKLLDEPVVTIPVEHNWERGLIGVTTSPNFPREPYIYVVYVTKEPYTHHRVSRFTLDGDTVVPSSEKILLEGDDQSKFGGNVPAGHQGGAIHFGNDGQLYVGIGEQTAKTPSQLFNALQGKLLRLSPDGSIPTDNPFLDKTRGKYGAIWAIGCRNPFTFAVQRSTGTIFINDVGGEFEEINRGIAGANYGWPDFDHGPADSEAITSPIHIYPQASISGGDFADGIDWPVPYRHMYFFADFVHGWIKMIDPMSPAESQTFAEGLRRPVDIRFGGDDSLYVLLRNAWVVDGKFEGGTGALMRMDWQEQR